MIRLLKALWRLIFGPDGVWKKIRKQAHKEVKDEEDSGGMDHVRDSSSAWFRRNR